MTAQFQVRLGLDLEVNCAEPSPTVCVPRIVIYTVCLSLVEQLADITGNPHFNQEILTEKDGSVQLIFSLG